MEYRPRYQEQEVYEKNKQYDEAIGFDPLETEIFKVNTTDQVVDIILEGVDKEKTFEYFNMWRKSRQGCYAITIQRKEPYVTVEYNVNSLPRIDFSKRTHMLLYGNKDDSLRIWKSISSGDKVKYLKIDVTTDYPIVLSKIPEE